MVVVQVEDPSPRPSPVPTLSLTSAILCEGSFPSNETPFCLGDESGAEGRSASKMLLYFQRLFQQLMSGSFMWKAPQ